MKNTLIGGIILVIAGSFLTTTIINNVNGQEESLYEKGMNVFNEHSDKKTYLCMGLEEYGGLDEDDKDTREDIKADCKDILENTDLFERKELIKQFGELE